MPALCTMRDHKAVPKSMSRVKRDISSSPTLEISTPNTTS